LPTESVNHRDGCDEPAKADERRRAGAGIDPATADVWFEYGQVLDPYGELELLPEHDCVGRQWFAADPVERIGVHFLDLPAATRDALQGGRQAADREAGRSSAAGATT
jgi:hypothetical protein